MDHLTEAQYESVLQYMQQFNEQSFQTAVNILKLHNYDLNTFKEYMKGLESQEQGQREEEQENLENDHYLMEEDEEEQIKRMKNFILKTAPDRVVIKRKKYTDCIKSLCLKITESLLPEIVKTRIIRSRFYQIYQEEAVVELKNKSMRQALKFGKEGRKNLVLIVSEDGKNHCLVQFLKKKKLLQKIKDQYEIVGLIDTELKNTKNTKIDSTIQLSEVSTNANSEIVQNSIFQDIHPPSVIVLRQRHTQELQIIEMFFGQQQILSIKQETLARLRQKIKSHVNKQASLLKRITDKMFEQSYNRISQGDPRFSTNTDHSYFMQKRIRAEQNKEYTAMENKLKQQKESQNKKYEEIEQLLEQRNCRKLSLPKEPQESESSKKIIKIIFRCPNGQNISRRFAKKQKCEIIFLWIDLNDDIQFEMDDSEENRIAKELQSCKKSSEEKVIVKERKFDLMYSYPPESLKSKMDMQIGDVFEDEEQIKILIKEE